ncbi:MAG TPA: AMP-binding protein [Polyangiaceae bacterium]|nr:AMP-binding protein [Polyangiaceae bacterium]
MSSWPTSAWFAQRRSELARVPVLAKRVLPAVRQAKASGTAPFVAWLEGHAERTPDALFCEQDQRRTSFAEARRRARRAARVLVDAGVRPGDVVALIGGNSPAYLELVFAVSYAGAAAALINPELRGEPLAHALRAVAPRLSLVESVVRRAWSESEASAFTSAVLDFGEGELDRLLERAVELERPRADAQGDFVYIFTSGTTGLPKPCRVSHERARSAATIFGSVAFDFRAGDKLYCALPLHHSSALLIGVGAALVAGVPIALRRKFSAREFAADLQRYGATATLYIGDMCRALVHSPETEAERGLRLRVAVGNGLQPRVWTEFQRRFGQPSIREFYASTEAPAAILNLTGTVGSLGHVPFERRRGFRLARLDAVQSGLARGADGWASECAADEPGELLLRVFPDAANPHGAFRGYTDQKASADRVAFDVFEPGDAYFRSGDVLRRDRLGYYYFVDRLGEAFRWKGENVSALEVERVLDSALGFPGVAVCGVAVPGYPGRAGLAEVVAPGAFDPSAFARAALALPAHARPCFVRPVPSLDHTSSFKIKKHALDLTRWAQNAFDAQARHAQNERLWLRQNDSYVVLTEELWDDLCRGQTRL